jgi:hypothetical protein
MNNIIHQNNRKEDTVGLRHFVVDGMLSGTGIRDAGEGGYISLEDLNISPNIRVRIQNWLSRYELEFYRRYSNETRIAELDKEGIEIALALQNELPDDQVGYYSDAKLKSMHESDLVHEA